MKLLNSMFLSDSMREAVAKAEKDISDRFITPDTSLMDLMCDPHTGFRLLHPANANRDAQIKAWNLFRQTRMKMLDPKIETSWTDLGFKAGPETSMMIARQEYLQALTPEDRDVFVNARFHKPHQIVRFSHLAKTAGTLLVFKNWWIGAKVQDSEERCVRPSGWMPERYTGILATTTPVKRAIYLNFGKVGGGTIYSLNDFQHRLSYELDVCPQYVNTALWVLGKRYGNDE